MPNKKKIITIKIIIAIIIILIKKYNNNNNLIVVISKLGIIRKIRIRVGVAYEELYPNLFRINFLGFLFPKKNLIPKHI
jgi:hypothetical protein